MADFDYLAGVQAGGYGNQARDGGRLQKPKEVTDDQNNIWQLVTPEEGGVKEYWWNEATGAVQWKNPTAPAAAVHWQLITAEGGGKPYWWDSNSGDVRWENPNAEPAAETAADADVVRIFICARIHILAVPPRCMD